MTQSKYDPNFMIVTAPDPQAPGYVMIAAVDRRLFNPEQDMEAQFGNMHFFASMPATLAMNVGSGIVMAGVAAANNQAAGLRERFYNRIASEHKLTPTDPEQLARLNSIISGFGDRDLDPNSGKLPEG